MAEFPGSVPTDRQSATSEYLSNMAGGFGHVALHNFHNNEIIALAAKLGTGASTPSASMVLRGTGSGTSAWGSVVLTTDVTGTLPVANGGTGATSAADARTNLGVSTLAATFDTIYPVGSIYINATSSTNPGTLLGFGTWTAFGAGRVMVGLNSGDTDFDTAEETGGAKTHTLTIGEMPAHTHTVTVGASGDTRTAGASDAFLGGSTTSSTGGGGAHNNLQPYIVVYMWKRTA